MARPQDPSANTPSVTSSTSEVTVRRAVTVSGAAGDPGNDLAPGGPRRGGDPAAADTGSSSEGASAAADAPSPVRSGDSVQREPKTADRESEVSKDEHPKSDGRESDGRESDEPTSRSGAEAAGRADSAAEEASSAPASAASGAAASSSGAAASSASSASASSATTGSAADGAVAEARGGGAGSATGGHTPPGGPKKPMLAAAAIIGTILIALPVVMLVRNDDEPTRNDRIDQAGDTVLDTARSQSPQGDYTSESPSPSPSRTVKPSNTVKAPPPAAPSPTKKNTEKKGPTAAEVLRQKANAASSASKVLLKNATTGLCADVPGFGKGANETRVNQYPCNGTDADNQLWDLLVSDKDGGPQGAALFQIRNSKDGLCLDLPGRGATPGMTRAQQYACDLDNDNQRWWLDPRPDGTYWIRNFVSDGLCLNVKGKADRRNDVPLDLGRCEDTSADDDRWTFA
ncbi:RICIN domain-containing protein [Streptomyces sp. NPDC088116]|uniref:RICIN domain-containing protein n=1 Tax=Streptomyces sp. NPDC088116 TaxID=3365825 RepID=UPI003805D111